MDGRYSTAPRAADTQQSKAVYKADERIAAAKVSLDALNEQQLLEIKTAAPATGPVKVGEGRDLAATATVNATASLLQWAELDGGARAAAIAFSAQGAYGVRLGVLVQNLPAQALVRVYNAAGDVEDTDGATINALLQANKDAGDLSAAGQTWWSPDLRTADITLEITIPAGVAAEEVQIAVPTLSHIYADVNLVDVENGQTKDIGDSESCNLDVSCYENGKQQRDSVARMVFTKGNGTYFCTGTLLNDGIASDTPYFLTANHCIADQTTASTLMTDWFFRAQTCDKLTLNEGAVRQRSGARLLVTTSLDTGHDMTLLVLNSAAPAGAFFAGWDANTVSTGSAVYGIHHPSGDLAKISGGGVTAQANCSAGARCTPISGNDGRFYEIKWSEGTTQGGSSGSAIFSPSSNRVLGTLFGGSASCSNRNAPDFYGRFDSAFARGMNRYLAASQRPSF